MICIFRLMEINNKFSEGHLVKVHIKCIPTCSLIYKIFFDFSLVAFSSSVKQWFSAQTNHYIVCFYLWGGGRRMVMDILVVEYYLNFKW